MKGAICIIGSGIGGLSAGVRLAQAGRKVILFEKESRTGGYAISYKRKGYRFDLALHVVPSGGPGQEFHGMVDSLGLSDKIKFIRLKEGFNVILGNYRFQMPNSYQQLQEVLQQEFADEQEGLSRFFSDTEEKARSYAPLFDYTVPKYRSVPSFLTKLPIFLKQSNQSTRDYFHSYFKDERLMAILFQPAVFMGIPMDEFPTVNFIMMFYLLFKNGMYTIEGGGQGLTDGLKEQFLELGGELKTSTPIQKIIIKDKRAQGVVCAKGTSYECDGVIGANSLHDVVNRLVGRSHFNKRYLDNLDALASSISVMALNLGLDCHPKDLGIDAHISMIFPDPDIDSCMRQQENRVNMNGFSITAHCNSDPGFNSDNRYNLSLVGGTDPDKWLVMDEAQYLAEKQRITDETIEMADKLYPGLKKHIQVTNLATPRTMFRYTANPLGAIMGPKCTCGSHRRIMKAANLPINNIIMGGAWTNRLGGFMQSMKSGILAAESLLK